jgi:hypothetical protein
LKDRFNKLVEVENENLKEHLNKITVEAPDRQQTGAMTPYPDTPDENKSGSVMHSHTVFGRGHALKHENALIKNEDSIEEEDLTPHKTLSAENFH